MYSSEPKTAKKASAGLKIIDWISTLGKNVTYTYSRSSTVDSILSFYLVLGKLNFIFILRKRFE